MVGGIYNGSTGDIWITQAVLPEELRVSGERKTLVVDFARSLARELDSNNHDGAKNEGTSMRRYTFIPTLVSLTLAIGIGCTPATEALPDDDPSNRGCDRHPDAATADRGGGSSDDAGAELKDGGTDVPDAADAAGDAADNGDAGAGGDQRDGGNLIWMTQPGVQPRLLSTDGANIYWTSASSVHACPFGDSCRDPIALGANEQRPTALAVDGTNVYWTTTDDAALGRGSIRYRPRDASGSGPITVTNNQQTPRCIAGGNGFVFWCTSQAEQNRNIHRARLDGSQETAAVSGSNAVSTMVLERGSGQIVWADAIGALSSITVQFAGNTQRTNQDPALSAAPIFSFASDGFVYFIESRTGVGSGSILRRRFSPSPGALEIVFSGGGTIVPKSLTISGRSLFFTTSAEGATPSQLYHLDLNSIPASNGAVTARLSATNLGDFEGVLALNGFLFVADPANNRILRILE